MQGSAAGAGTSLLVKSKYYHLCAFPLVAITNHHGLNGFKQKCVILRFSGSAALKSRGRQS